MSSNNSAPIARKVKLGTCLGLAVIGTVLFLWQFPAMEEVREKCISPIGIEKAVCQAQAFGIAEVSLMFIVPFVIAGFLGYDLLQTRHSKEQ